MDIFWCQLLKNMSNLISWINFTDMQWYHPHSSAHNCFGFALPGMEICFNNELKHKQKRYVGDMRRGASTNKLSRANSKQLGVLISEGIICTQWAYTLCVVVSDTPLNLNSFHFCTIVPFELLTLRSNYTLSEVETRILECAVKWQCIITFARTFSNYVFTLYSS
jgi:hypothetical protein